MVQFWQGLGAVGVEHASKRIAAMACTIHGVLPLRDIAGTGEAVEQGPASGEIDTVESIKFGESQKHDLEISILFQVRLHCVPRGCRILATSHLRCSTESPERMPSLSSRVLPAIRPAHLRHTALLRANAASSTDNVKPINLSVAENVLSLSELCKGLATHDGGDLLVSLAKHLSHGYKVLAENLCITMGATSAMDAVAHVLCERGDKMLLPAPGYAALERDVSTRSGVCALRYEHAVTGIELLKSVEDALTHDTKVLVIINPTNPTGEVIDAAGVRQVAAWAVQREIHVVFDEAYAESVYKGRFCGIHEAMGGVMGTFVHVVYTLSKDFGSSGARIGVIHSQNKAVVAALRGVGAVTSVCEHTSLTFGGLLNDRTWVCHFLGESRRRLRMGYEVVARVLRELRIPFVEAVAGVFVWADLSELQDDTTRAWERLFEGGVLVTPGEDCWGGKGWCRFCFASVDPDVLIRAMDRLRQVVVSFRSQK